MPKSEGEKWAEALATEAKGWGDAFTKVASDLFFGSSSSKSSSNSSSGKVRSGGKCNCNDKK